MYRIDASTCTSTLFSLFLDRFPPRIQEVFQHLPKAYFKREEKRKGTHILWIFLNGALLWLSANEITFCRRSTFNVILLLPEWKICKRAVEMEDGNVEEKLTFASIDIWRFCGWPHVRWFRVEVCFLLLRWKMAEIVTFGILKWDNLLLVLNNFVLFQWELTAHISPPDGTSKT